MAQVFARMTVKIRWWVKPYCWALWLFGFCFCRAMDEDDAAAWLERVGEWIAKHGLVCKLER